MRARETALCALLTALAVTLLLLGGLVPGATFCAPLLAMAVLLPVLEELGTRAAGLCYGAAALLSLLLAADREMALVYLFFGWYPLLRPRLNRLSSRFLRALAKTAVYAAALALFCGLTLGLLGLTETGGSRVLEAVLPVMGGGVFFLTDLCLERLSGLWRRKLRRRFFP